MFWIIAVIVAAAPSAEEVDAASYLSGGRQVNEEGNVVEDAWGLIDGDVETQYEPKLDSKTVLIQFAEPFDLSRIEVVNSRNEQTYPGISVKQLKVEGAPSLKGPWSAVAQMSLKKGTAPQQAAAPAKAVRFVRVTFLSNYGNAEWYGLSELSAFGKRSAARTPNFTGAWDTRYGQLVLKQDGQRITGCYGSEQKSGLATVEGTLEGPIFVGAWREYNEDGSTRREGGIALALTQERDLSGVWGSDLSKNRNNRWDGTRKDKADITCERPEKALATELQEKGRVVLRGILFDTGKDVIRSESIPVLQALAAAIKAHPDQQYVVEGHTDDRGGREFNQTLSEKRAASVKAWLTKNAVKAEQLKTVGYGMSRPTLPNDTEAGRAANRRVEVAVAR